MSYLVKTGSRYRNKKNQTVYTVKGVVRNTTNGTEPRREVMVVYGMDRGPATYCREYNEFVEKFEEVKC